MKQIFIIAFSLIVLMMGSGVVYASESYHIDVQVSDIQLSQTIDDLSRPILVNVTDASKIRERNETKGLGGIFKATINTNVTIMYKMMNGDNFTQLNLYVDLPDRNGFLNTSETLSFTHVLTSVENITLPYTGDEFVNATVSYYSVELNVTSAVVPFTARSSLTAEDSSSPRNLFTVKQYWSINPLEDFYIQEENVTIQLAANDTDATDLYGLRYTVDGGSYIFENFTTVADGNNETGEINLGNYSPQTKLVVEAYTYIARGNETQIVEMIDMITIEIGDGTPELNLVPFNTGNTGRLVNETYYTQNGTVFFNISAVVPKGNITDFRFNSSLISGNFSVKPTVNASLEGETMNTTIEFPEGKTELLVITETNKALITNRTLLVVFDKTTPTLSLSSTAGVGNVALNTTSGLVEFEFTADDENSGVRQVLIDYGDGISEEVTGLSNTRHIYTGFTDTFTFEVTLTVLDEAGNTNKAGLLVTLTYNDGITETKVNTFWGTFLFILILVVVFTLPRIIEFIQNRRG